ALQDADGVIAVSEAVASELRAVSIPRVSVLPNIVDAAEVDEIAKQDPVLSLPDRFVLFVGKLEANKGACDLVPVVKKAGITIPLVVLGSGNEESRVRERAADEAVELHMRGWTARGEGLRWPNRPTAHIA